jgi:hypothetical protein|tara:strand:- start:167 stop:1150 length:984 start_codon:yes stop_codon:yes gene_type:complete
MAVNKIFHDSNLTSIASERNLYKDLIKEAIQIHGHDVYYIDRTSVAQDDILGEDALSKYRQQQPIEMYVEDAESGYSGDKELMTQFGLDNRNEITFVVHKERFQELTKQITIESGTDTTGGSIQLEDGTVSNDGKFETHGTELFYLLGETDPTDADRPLEGDLVYHPVLGKIFEVGFVDHDAPFHQLDNNPIYKLRCRQYEYDSAILDTGISTIDEIEDNNSLDALIHQFTLEQSSAVNEKIRLERFIDDGLLLEETDGDFIIGENDSTSVGESILLENGSFLINEDYIIGDKNVDKTAQNEFITQQVTSENILDFSEKNPFGDAGA